MFDMPAVQIARLRSSLRMLSWGFLLHFWRTLFHMVFADQRSNIIPLSVYLAFFILMMPTFNSIVSKALTTKLNVTKPSCLVNLEWFALLAVLLFLLRKHFVCLCYFYKLFYSMRLLGRNNEKLMFCSFHNLPDVLISYKINWAVQILILDVFWQYKLLK